MAVLSYHVHDPLECPDCLERIMYYLGYTILLPTAIFNGTDQEIGGTQQTFSIYDTKHGQQMEINVPGILSTRVEYDSSGRDGTIMARFTSVDQISESDLRLRYAVTESHKYFPWEELDSLHFIVRDMLPDHEGVPLSINQGETVVDTQSFYVDSTWEDHHCELVVWVQSDQDTTVLISNSLPLHQTHISGDANGDGVVTISDATFLATYFLFERPGPEPSASGDPNEDCQIDVQDVTYLVDYLFHRGSAPLRGWEID